MKEFLIKMRIYDVIVIFSSIYVLFFLFFIASEIGIIHLDRSIISIIGRFTLISTPILLILSPILILKTEKKLYKAIGIVSYVCVVLTTLVSYLVMLGGI